MSGWINVQAHQVAPVPVHTDQRGDLDPRPPQAMAYWQLRVQRSPGPVPDSTKLDLCWMGQRPGEAPGQHGNTWHVEGATLRATPTGTVLHTFHAVGPAAGTVVVSVDDTGGLVAELHYPTLPGPYRLDML